MTHEQYYFPYLFRLENFRNGLSPFGLTAIVHCDEETSMPDRLLLCRVEAAAKPLLSLPFGTTLMIANGRLLYWETDTNLLDISEVILNELTDDPWIMRTKIDLALLAIGKNEFSAQLDTAPLVTFARKSSISYNKASYEQYAVVIIQKEQVTIIPLDGFNKANSQYDYTWPAIARLNLDTGKLYGEGMRMPPFCITLSDFMG